MKKEITFYHPELQKDFIIEGYISPKTMIWVRLLIVLGIIYDIFLSFISIPFWIIEFVLRILLHIPIYILTGDIIINKSSDVWIVGKILHFLYTKYTEEYEWKYCIYKHRCTKQ